MFKICSLKFSYIVGGFDPHLLQQLSIVANKQGRECIDNGPLQIFFIHAFRKLKKYLK
jgi:hypothetical protein